MALKAGFQEKLLFFSFFGVWGFSLSRYLIQAAISAASRHLSKNARQSGDTISSNINTFNTRYRKGAIEGGKGLKLDHVKPCVVPHSPTDIKKDFLTQIVYLGHIIVLKMIHGESCFLSIRSLQKVEYCYF